MVLGLLPEQADDVADKGHDGLDQRRFLPVDPRRCEAHKKDGRRRRRGNEDVVAVGCEVDPGASRDERLDETARRAVTDHGVRDNGGVGVEFGFEDRQRARQKRPPS